MKKIISKRDNKEYYLAVLKNEFVDEFIDINNRYIGIPMEGTKYQVRKATKEDCDNPENYCVVNGQFFNETFLLTQESLKLLNRYTGTRCFDVIVSKEICRNNLKYID